MEKPQVRTPKARPKRQSKLGLAPSSDFSWFSSILHRKRTGNTHSADPGITEWQAPDRGSRQGEHMRGSLGTGLEATSPVQRPFPPAATPLMSGGVNSETMQETHTGIEPGGAEEVASTKMSTVAEINRMKLPAPESTQSGPHLDPIITTARPEPQTTAPLLSNYWEGMSPSQTESNEQAKKHQTDRLNRIQQQARGNDIRHCL